MGALAACLLKILTNHLLSERRKTATIPTHRFLFIRQHHINVSPVYSRSFSPEIRYFFLTYTKYACEKLPFSTKNLWLNPRRQFIWYCRY